MRIVAGAAKGRRLTAPSGDHVRPTADRTREALFASLQPMLVGARVLDLFAGSGALGLEAASRGAAAVTFVERDRRALTALQANVEVVGMADIAILARAVEAAWPQIAARAPFDLVLADPPYDLDDATVDRIIDRLPALLADGAEVVVERATRRAAPTWPATLTVRAPRRYGAATLHRATYAAPAAGTATGGPSEGAS